MAGNDMPELTLALQQQLSALLRSNPDLIRSLAGTIPFALRPIGEFT